MTAFCGKNYLKIKQILVSTFSMLETSSRISRRPVKLVYDNWGSIFTYQGFKPQRNQACTVGWDGICTCKLGHRLQKSNLKLKKKQI